MIRVLNVRAIREAVCIDGSHEGQLDTPRCSDWSAALLDSGQRLLVSPTNRMVSVAMYEKRFWALRELETIMINHFSELRWRRKRKIYAVVEYNRGS